MDGWEPGHLLSVVKSHRGRLADFGTCEYRVRCEPDGGYTLVFFDGNRADLRPGQYWDFLSPMLEDLMAIPRDADGKPTAHHRMTLKRWFRPASPGTSWANVPRRVLVPRPEELLHLEVSGPTSPRAAKSIQGVKARFEFEVMIALGEEAKDSDGSGWACWWASPPLASGHSIRLHLWLADDTRGERSREALQARLEAASFVVRCSGSPRTPEPVLRGETPLYARRRDARMGTKVGSVAVDFVIDALVTRVEVEPQWRWQAQRCPRCGHRGHPLEIMDGFPTADATFAVGIGEAVFGGCVVEEWTGFAAECASCGGGFQPR